MNVNVILCCVLIYWILSVIACLFVYHYQHNKFPPSKYVIIYIVLGWVVLPLLAFVLPLEKGKNDEINVKWEKEQSRKKKLLRYMNSHISENDDIPNEYVKTLETFLAGVSETSYFRTHDIKNMSTRDLNRLRDKLKHQLEIGKFNDEKEENILESMDAITIKKGYTLDYYGPTRTGCGGSCYFYVTPIGGSSDDGDRDIYKYLTIEASTKGAWQAFILYTAWHSMPLFWHANYDKWTRIYSYQDWEEKRRNLIATGKGNENSFINWQRLETLDVSSVKDDFVPKVFFENNEAFVRCYVWNSFSGINRYSLHIAFTDSGIQFTELEEKTVIGCTNGILL